MEEDWEEIDALSVSSTAQNDAEWDQEDVGASMCILPRQEREERQKLAQNDVKERVEMLRRQEERHAEMFEEVRKRAQNDFAARESQLVKDLRSQIKTLTRRLETNGTSAASRRRERNDDLDRIETLEKRLEASEEALEQKERQHKRIIREYEFKLAELQRGMIAMNHSMLQPENWHRSRTENEEKKAFEEEKRALKKELQEATEAADELQSENLELKEEKRVREEELKRPGTTLGENLYFLNYRS
jgi:FtsZ-binding cell division protein ZapB